MVSFCDATLNVFLRYFGYKVVPIEDVEFVTEKYEETSRDPKYLRLQTRMPFVKIEQEMFENDTNSEMTTESMNTTTKATIKFNPLSPDIINAIAENLLITSEPTSNNTNNSQSHTEHQTTMKNSVEINHDHEETTEFLIKLPPLDTQTKLEKLSDPELNSSMIENEEKLNTQMKDYLGVVDEHKYTGNPNFEIIKSMELPSESEFVVGDSILVSDSQYQMPPVPPFQQISVPPVNNYLPFQRLVNNNNEFSNYYY